MCACAALVLAWQKGVSAFEVNDLLYRRFISRQGLDWDAEGPRTQHLLSWGGENVLQTEDPAARWLHYLPLLTGSFSIQHCSGPCPLSDVCLWLGMSTRA
jgi:hypothetical protein